MRSGIGIDSHRFEAGRRLVLGGVEVPFELGLAGYSDADVLAHAAWKDADSMQLLRDVVARVREAGHELVHVDATVMLERPKLAPYRDSIVASLAASVSARGENVAFNAASSSCAASACAQYNAR